MIFTSGFTCTFRLHEKKFHEYKKYIRVVIRKCYTVFLYYDKLKINVLKFVSRLEKFFLSFWYIEKQIIFSPFFKSQNSKFEDWTDEIEILDIINDSAEVFKVLTHVSTLEIKTI